MRSQRHCFEALAQRLSKVWSKINRHSVVHRVMTAAFAKPLIHAGKANAKGGIPVFVLSGDVHWRVRRLQQLM